MRISPSAEMISRLEKMREMAKGRVPLLPAPYPAVTLIFSVSDGDRRAVTIHRSGPDFDTVWGAVTEALATEMQRHKLTGRDLRLDWVEGAETWNWALLRSRLDDVKRNYSRRGLAIGQAFDFLFTEQEINARAMLYGGNRSFGCVLNEKNFTLAVQQKYGPKNVVMFADDAPVHVIDTVGIYCGEDEVPHALYGRGKDAGRRVLARLDGTVLSGVIESAARFLADQVQADGKFIYGYHPCFDREIPSYNALRHASTCYSMLEAWEKTRDPHLMQAIERALDGLCRHFLRERDGRAYIVDIGDEVKLGANATAILAMAKYAEVCGSERFLPTMRALAEGILHMQEENGAFTHVLQWPSLETKEKFRIVYYEGEAAFALMRLYKIDPNSRWIDAVELAFDHFIRDEYWKHHDHWLGYCTNELTIYRPETRYFEFGIRNFEGYLDFVRDRITTFPTLLEMMMAGRKMLDRLADIPSAQHLLARVDQAAFDDALHTRARYLLNGYFWPEYAMFMRNPDRVRGSFFIRHHAFRVRIDDVEHYLSGLLAYADYYSEGRIETPLPIKATGWNAENVVYATGGHWIDPPAHGWQARGIATYAPAAEDNYLLMVKDRGSKIGITPEKAVSLPRPAGYIIGQDSDFTSVDAPVLRVSDTTLALYDLAKYARKNIAARVVGITGSAGKTTTTALISHVLRNVGNVAASRHNANLPVGVAWNLASMDRQADYAVLELAVGNMRRSSAISSPDVAVFTNIQPAHLGMSHTTTDIARAKSNIFSGMQQGAFAVLNADMLHFDIVLAAAQERELQVITYGKGKNVDVRLVSYQADTARVVLDIRGASVALTLAAPGEHMAYNAAAVGAVLLALGVYSRDLLKRVEAFSALAGRGEVVALSSARGDFTLIDDAYNANPGSMEAALKRLAATAGKRRIAVLGQMEDLGEQADAYHNRLLPVFLSGAVDSVFLIGPRYRALWDVLPDRLKGGYFSDLGSVRAAIMKTAQDGDVFLLKGSHSTDMHKVVDWMKRVYRPKVAVGGNVTS